MLVSSSQLAKEQGASRLVRFIICWGWEATADIFDAPNVHVARAEAERRGMDEGLWPDELTDTCWAAPYTEWLARKVGLLDDPDDAHCATRCDPRAFQRW